MGQASPLRRKLRARRPGPRSLTVRLAAVAACLLAAGVAIMVVAGSLATRDALARQAGEQLRSYAGQLARYPFLLTPLSRTGPGPPGLSDLASAGAGNLNVEVRSAGGQLVMRAGPGRRAGPGLPASAVRVLADHREAGTVRVSQGGNLLAIAVPVHYRAHHIPYAYGAEDFTLDITSPAGRGAPGTLLVSLSLAGVGRAANHLAVIMLAMGAIVVVATGCLAGGMARAVLRPLTRLADRAEGIAAGQPPAGCQPSRPDRAAPALDALLSRLEQARDPGREPGPPAWRAAGGSVRPSRTPAGRCAGRSASWAAWPTTTGMAGSSPEPQATTACWPGSRTRPRGSARSSTPWSAPGGISLAGPVPAGMSAGVRNLGLA